MPSGLEVKTWIELNDFYEKTVEMYKGQFGVLQLIILVMVLLSVANSVNMSIFERTGEFGTMMALGNRRSQMFRLIIVENLIARGNRGGLGLVTGMGPRRLLYPQSAFLCHRHQMPTWAIQPISRLVPSVLMMSGVIGIRATVLAAIFRQDMFPVYQSSRR